MRARFRLALPALVLAAGQVRAGESAAAAKSPPHLPATAPAPEGQPARSTAALASLPDLSQSDPRLGFGRGGVRHCAPVAVANTLLHLAATGWPRLAPACADETLRRIDVAKSLAGPRYLNTSLAEGTTTTGLLRGIARYVADRGYTPRVLHYAGWRFHPRAFAAPSLEIEPRAVERALIEPGSGAWLNIGWYRRGDDATWQRVGGHWVTLGGFGVDERGQPAADSWLLRDPAACGAQTSACAFVRLEKANVQRLVGPQPELPRAGAGLWRLVGGLVKPDDANEALLDGVVVLVLEPAA